MGDVLILREGILTSLRKQSALQVFDGQPDQTGNKPIKLDPDKLAGMYAALYMGVGVPERFSENAAVAESRVDVTFQVTCAGGDSNRALRSALKVRDALTGNRIAQGWGPLRELLNAVNARPDPPGDTPTRWFVPMIFGTRED